MDDFAKQLEEYQARVQSWFELLKRMRLRYNKEQNTTVKFVVPLLEMLGWDPLTRDMEFEYFIPVEKTRGGRVDVALFTGKSRTPKFLIEVKPFQSKSVDNRWTQLQIFKYLVKSKTDYGVVTNGRELALYSRRHVRPDYKRPRKLFGLTVEDFVRYESVLQMLSKGMVENGTFDRLAEAYHSKRYWLWRKENQSDDRADDEYRLPLEFAAKINDAG